MPSTEFLLFLVVVMFAAFIFASYYKNDSNQIVRYKYIPVHSSSSERNDDDNDNNNNNYRTQKKGNRCGNPQCMKYGKCICGGMNTEDMNVDIHNTPNPGMQGMGMGMGVGVGGPPIDPLRKFDYDAVSDEFTPPFRRSYYDDYNYRLTPGLMPTYTRGPPGRFRKIGTLIAEGVSANDNYKFMLLMGRQKYPSRDEYEYYATSSDTEQKVKFFIDTKGKQIHDCDIVKIDELEGYSYKFKEDQDLSPRYDPYFYL